MGSHSEIEILAWCQVDFESYQEWGGLWPVGD